MQSREIWFIGIAAAVAVAVCARALIGQPPAQIGKQEWRRQVLARGLAVVGLAIGIAVLLDNLALKR